MIRNFRKLGFRNFSSQPLKYLYRYIDASGSILTKDQYDTMMSGGQNAYIAAFVGCTYHCG